MDLELTWLQNNISEACVVIIVDFKFSEVVIGVNVVAVDAVGDEPGDTRRKLDRALKFQLNNLGLSLVHQIQSINQGETIITVFYDHYEGLVVLSSECLSLKYRLKLCSLLAYEF